GACFRDFSGVRVYPDNTVEWDPNVERKYLPSGKPLVPNYEMSFMPGTSSNLGLAFQGVAGDRPLYTLPEKFPMKKEQVSSESSEEAA
ncbi:DNA (cytosine-5)-methyltransferase cmt3-like protein, partial [Trifolium pratense]